MLAAEVAAQLITKVMEVMAVAQQVEIGLSLLGMV
jgi:hypothetical protein